MKKKIIGILVVTLLIATVVSPAVNCLRNEKNLSNEGFFNNKDVNYSYDEIDQSQNQLTHFKPTYQHNGWKLAYIQSFKPTFPTLTRVSVFIQRYGDPFLEDGKIQVVIKSELDPGNWMTSVDLTLNDFPQGSHWIEVDLDDIYVEPERTYFLLVKPVNIYNSVDDRIEWGTAESYSSDYYDRGDAYWNNGPGFEIWRPSGKYIDFCFKTYGIPNQPPNNPTCTYHKDSGFLTIAGSDPDDDNVRYGISWENNQQVDHWTIFVESGREVSVDCEGRKGIAVVITEDEYGEQSYWTIVQTKNKSISDHNPWLNRLIQRFPILELLL